MIQSEFFVAEGFLLGPKSPWQKPNAKRLRVKPEWNPWGSILWLHYFQECRPCSPALSVVFPNKARHSRILISFGLKTVKGSRLSGHGHPGMPPEAELRETKCPFVLEKVKLVTLIYPGRRSHPGLALVPLSPVDVPGRADRTQESVCGAVGGKVGKLLISLWCMGFN